jgi:YHS domain-containing protein
MRKTHLGALLAAALLAVATIAGALHPARAGEAPVYTGFLSNLAVGGYDPVAYFADGRPVEGSSEFESRYKGATWRFASAAHKASFDAEPERYAPQYGGYCAWAVSQGYTAKGDPETWKIVGGRLYLNYNADAQKLWEEDIPAHIRAGDENWPKLTK